MGERGGDVSVAVRHCPEERRRLKTALITTCYREAEAVDGFLDAILGQSRRPDEILIVDAGSDDGTVERIRRRIADGAPITLLVEPGANRSRGRNLAVERSSAQLIAVTDVGAEPREDWFATIIAPLERDAEADVVAGYYEARPRTLWGAAVAAATVPVLDEVDPASFLPSARSIAFRRDAWQRVGGYPESSWVSEDTAFDLALKQAGAQFVLEPRAIVAWEPHASPVRLFRQFRDYARGDAEVHFWFRHYTKAYVLVAGLLAGIIGGFFWPPLWVGTIALIAAYWARHARRALRRTEDRAAALLAPAANLIVDFAHVIGYTWGLAHRRSG